MRPEVEKTGWRRFVRPQDIVWLLLFSALGVVTPGHNDAVIQVLFALALLQVLEPRIAYFTTPQGNIAAILLKLLLGFLLIGVSGGILSTYYIILLLPVVSAATSMGARGATVLTSLACAAYLSFLLFAYRLGYVLPPELLRDVTVRVLFLTVVGYLTYQLAEQNRCEARRYQTVAEELAQANFNLREAEETVRRSERLVALGQLSAGLAHELRNPMGTMKASAEMLLSQTDTGTPVARELAGYIASEVDRANALITRFLEFARPVTLRTETGDITEVIDSAAEQVKQHTPNRNVTIYKNYAPEVPPLPMDAQLMERVMYNLLINAVEASPAGGAITVKTRRLEGAVEVAVIDRGQGIPEALRESIFNPFVTNKPDGVGLGLAIVSKIVDEHNGTISVESEVGKGSVFRILLPIEG
jgi:two-component system, NtrC family, sensor histidine kinase HydH